MSQEFTNPSSSGFAAHYFNGKQSAGQAVVLRAEAGALTVASTGADGWVRRVLPRHFAVAESTAHAPLLLKFADGSHIECAAGKDLFEELRGIGVKASGAATVFSSWKLSVITLAFLLAALTAAYVWLIPSLAEVAAPMVPQSWQDKLGSAVLKQLDTEMLRPSKLPAEQQAALSARFDLLVGAVPKTTPYTLLFRSSARGPNAFALPGNIVVMTDELVLLVKGDVDALSGVLAHELGHHVNHHMLRNLIHSSALAIIGAAFIGDYSGVLAAAPAVLGQSRYSRTLEVEADLHAKRTLCRLKMPLEPTAGFFAQLQKQEGNSTLNKLFSYVNSHPPSDKRRQYFQSGCADLPAR